ncbi:hypothetical protein [Halocatena pleomorpha]|uniref:Uncharacterized protein n=1 Tax=Halocatena pleomorpha TaxID=1785090 RepID=A0A3P3RGI9_9EURY|nr:hypothetical protein [Halocatena pleomorpha]RRJ31860.1 hypothetical protein EIK79_06245 [Halocatena pleomorpha]
MVAGYILLALPGVFLPILDAGEIPGISLVFFGFICATGSGLAFGMELLGVEYPVLPMTLTTIHGQQFIRGTIFAGVVISAPITTVGVIALGLGSSISSVEVILVALTSVVLCMYSVTLACAIGMGVSYYEFRVVPLPFTGTAVHAEGGRESFIRLGAVVILLALVCLPIFGGYLSVISGPVATVLDTSIVVVRLCSLVLTTILAATISVPTYRLAVKLFNQYSIP